MQRKTILKNKGEYSVIDRDEYGYEMRHYSMIVVVKDGNYYDTQVVTISLQYYVSTDIWIAPRIREADIPLDNPYSRTDWTNRQIQKKFNTFMAKKEIDAIHCDYDVHVKDFIYHVLDLEFTSQWAEGCKRTYEVANKLNIKAQK